MDELEILCIKLKAWQLDNKLCTEDPFIQVLSKSLTKDQYDYLYNV